MCMSGLLAFRQKRLFRVKKGTGAYTCKPFTHKMCRPILDLYAQEDRLKYTSSGLLFPPSALILTWETFGVGRMKALAAQAKSAKIAAVFIIKRRERSCGCV